MATKQPRIRDAIQLLSTILSANCGMAKIPSETFRLGKFNSPEAVTTFQQLLSKLVELNTRLDRGEEITSVRTERSERMGGGTTPLTSEDSFTSLTVRRLLFDLGYRQLTFFADPSGGGSRELLLATIWMLHKTKLISKLIGYHVRMAARRFMPLADRMHMLAESEEVDHVTGVLKNLKLEVLEQTNMEGLRDCVQKLVWLRGRLCAKWRAVFCTQQAYQKLAHSLTTPLHLTVHELYLLQHPAELDVYLRNLEWHNTALEKLVEWTRHEDVFWKWAISIVDLKEKESKMAAASGSAETTGPEVRTDSADPEIMAEQLSREVHRLQLEVASLMERNVVHYNHILAVWTRKCGGIPKHEVTKEEARLTVDLPAPLDGRTPLKFTPNDFPVYHSPTVGGGGGSHDQVPPTRLPHATPAVCLSDVIHQHRRDVMVELEHIERQLIPKHMQRLALH